MWLVFDVTDFQSSVMAFRGMAEYADDTVAIWLMAEKSVGRNRVFSEFNMDMTRNESHNPFLRAIVVAREMLRRGYPSISIEVELEGPAEAFDADLLGEGEPAEDMAADHLEEAFAADPRMEAVANHHLDQDEGPQATETMVFPVQHLQGTTLAFSGLSEAYATRNATELRVVGSLQRRDTVQTVTAVLALDGRNPCLKAVRACRRLLARSFQNVTVEMDVEV